MLDKFDRAFKFIKTEIKMELNGKDPCGISLNVPASRKYFEEIDVNNLYKNE